MISLGYYLKEGFVNLFKRKKQVINSIIVMSLTLLIFGAFILITFNSGQILTNLKNEQGVQAFIRDKDAGEPEDEYNEMIKKLGEQLRKIEWVNSAEFVSNVEGFEKFKKSWEQNPALFEGIEAEILPNSYIVKVTDINKLSEVKSEIEKNANIFKVSTPEKIVDFVMTVSNVANVVIAVIGFILMLFSLTVMSNAIRFTVEARKREISIMKYVGATDAFIKGPFVVEALFIALFSTLIAGGILIAGYQLIEIYFSAFVNAMESQLSGSSDISVTLVAAEAIIPMTMAIFLIASSLIAIFSSTNTMKKHLKV